MDVSGAAGLRLRGPAAVLRLRFLLCQPAIARLATGRARRQIDMQGAVEFHRRAGAEEFHRAHTVADFERQFRRTVERDML